MPSTYGLTPTEQAWTTDLKAANIPHINAAIATRRETYVTQLAVRRENLDGLHAAVDTQASFNTARRRIVNLLVAHLFEIPQQTRVTFGEGTWVGATANVFVTSLGEMSDRVVRECNDALHATRAFRRRLARVDDDLSKLEQKVTSRKTTVEQHERDNQAAIQALQGALTQIRQLQDDAVDAYIHG